MKKRHKQRDASGDCSLIERAIDLKKTLNKYVFLWYYASCDGINMYFCMVV